MRPYCIVLGGPNGSGKSTLCNSAHFLKLLREWSVQVINPDELAKEAPTSSNALIWSGRRVHQLINDKIKERSSFLIESTLSGRNHFATINKCREAGYFIALHFVFATSLDLLKARINTRVKLGGHDVPEMDQDRRYLKSLGHGLEFAALADEAFFYANETEMGHVEVAQFAGGRPVRISPSAPVWLKTGRFGV